MSRANPRPRLSGVPQKIAKVPARCGVAYARRNGNAYWGALSDFPYALLQLPVSKVYKVG